MSSESNSHPPININRREELLPVLQTICEEKGFLSTNDMKEVAKKFSLSAAEVYGTATFYSFLQIGQLGKNIIRICKTITCNIKEKELIVETLQQRLNIKMGQTTADSKFTLMETNCLGQCHKGPAMLINNDVYTDLTAEKALKALEKY